MSVTIKLGMIITVIVAVTILIYTAVLNYPTLSTKLVVT